MFEKRLIVKSDMRFENMRNDVIKLPIWAWKMTSLARVLRALCTVRSLSLNREMKKERKVKGVIERILHFKAPKIRHSILCIVCVSNIRSPSAWTKDFRQGYFIHTHTHILKTNIENCVLRQQELNFTWNWV